MFVFTIFYSNNKHITTEYYDCGKITKCLIDFDTVQFLTILDIKKLYMYSHLV